MYTLFGTKRRTLATSRTRRLAAIVPLFAIVFSVSRTGAQPATTQPNTGGLPRAELIGPHHDFGKFAPDSRLAHTFRVRNSGGQPLLIKQVAPDCSCTTTLAHPAQIAPGTTSDFSFEINTAKLPGSFFRYVNVLTNDPVTPTISFSMAGESMKQVDVVPTSLSFGRLVGNNVRELVATITNRSNRALNARIDGPAVSGRFSFDLIASVPGTEYKLFAVVRPPYEEGTLSGSITIATNIAGQEKITITASGVVPPMLEVVPPKITVADKGSVTSAPAPGPTIAVCELTNLSAELVQIIKATANDPELSVETREIERGRLYRILVSMPADYRVAPEGRMVQLTTDSTKKPIVTIPVQSRASAAQGATKPSTTQPAVPAKNKALELVGKPAPRFSTLTTVSSPVGTETFGGHPATVLNFVAPNCPFCKRQLPNIERVRLEYEPMGVRFLNMSETLHGKVFSPMEAQSVYESAGAHLETVMDPDNKIGGQFNVSSFPVLMVVSKDGRVLDALIGAKEDNANTLREILRAELDKESNGGPGWKAAKP